MEKHDVTFAIPDLNETTVGDARKLFTAYRDRKVFLNASFEDQKWLACDEYARYGLNFSIDDEEYRAFRNSLDISKEDFEKYLKTFCVCEMGALAIGTIRSIVYGVKKVVRSMNDESGIKSLDTVLNILQVADFFSILPVDPESKALTEILESLDDMEDTMYGNPSGNQRNLAAFESYFRFDEILKRFWAESQDEDEKLFFFPVWFWWNVSAVLPLRPREFILTPRSCITRVKGKYYLTVRRNKIKGSGKTKTYRLEGDYETFRYEIPESLAKEIRWYQKKTKNCAETDIHTLFVTDTHYSRWERHTPYNSRFFTYINMKTCLRYFYEEIVVKRYGYHVLYERGNSVLTDEKDINYLQLGDTRHIALINLIAEGATPMVAMMLAGHDNPDMSAHYYSNISTLIECRTYRQYKQLTGEKQSYHLSVPSGKLITGEFTILEDHSRCYSPGVRKGDFSDCYRTTGPGGEVGLCLSCGYHMDEGMSFRDAKDLYKEKINRQCENLTQIVSKVRKGRGEPEEIIQEILKLQDSAYSYQQYLREKMEADYAEK